MKKRFIIPRVLSVTLAASMVMTSVPVNASVLSVNAAAESGDILDETAETVSGEDIEIPDAPDLFELDIRNASKETIDNYVLSNPHENVASWYSALSDEDKEYLDTITDVFTNWVMIGYDICAEDGIVAGEYDSYAELLELISKCGHVKATVTKSVSKMYLNAKLIRANGTETNNQLTIQASGLTTNQSDSVIQKDVSWTISGSKTVLIPFETYSTSSDGSKYLDVADGGAVSNKKSVAVYSSEPSIATGTEFDRNCLIFPFRIKKPNGYKFSGVTYGTTEGHKQSSARLRITPRKHVIKCKYTSGSKKGESISQVVYLATTTSQNQDILDSFGGAGSSPSEKTSEVMDLIFNYYYHGIAANETVNIVFNEITYTHSYAKGSSTEGAATNRIYNYLDNSKVPTADSLGLRRKTTITYNANGGTCPVASETKACPQTSWTANSTTVNNGSNTNSLPGSYTYTPVYGKASFTLPKPTGPAVTAAFSTNGGSAVSSITANKVFTGWKIGSTTVTSTTYSTADSVTATAQYGSASIKLPAAPVKDGSTFSGWSYTSGGTTKVAPAGGTVALTSNTTFTALYNEKSYTIIFDKNSPDADGETDPMIVKYDAKENLNENGYSRTGYTFKGWSTSENGGVVYSDGQEILNLITPATSNPADWIVNLYAVWEADRSTVTFNTGFGSGLSPVTVEGLETFPLPVSTKEGYEMIGWADSEDALDISYEPNELYSALNGSATLYAVWIEKPEDYSQIADILGKPLDDMSKKEMATLKAYIKGKTGLTGDQVNTLMDLIRSSEISDVSGIIKALLNSYLSDEKYGELKSLIEASDISDESRTNLLEVLGNLNRNVSSITAELLDRIMAADNLSDKYKKEIADAVKENNSNIDEYEAIREAVMKLVESELPAETIAGLIRKIAFSDQIDENTLKLIEDILNSDINSGDMAALLESVADKNLNEEVVCLIENILGQAWPSNFKIELITKILNSAVADDVAEIISGLISDDMLSAKEKEIINSLLEAEVITGLQKDVINSILDSELTGKESWVEKVLQSDAVMAGYIFAALTSGGVITSNEETGIKTAENAGITDERVINLINAVLASTSVPDKDKPGYISKFAGRTLTKDEADALKKLVKGHDDTIKDCTEPNNPAPNPNPVTEIKDIADRLSSIESTSELTNGEIDSLKTLVSSLLGQTDKQTNSLIDLISGSKALSEAQKIQILYELSKGYLDDESRKLLTDAVNKSNAADKKDILEAIKGISSLTYDQQKKIIEQLNKGSSASYNYGGITYKITKGADGTLTAGISSLNGQSTVVIPNQVIIAGRAYAVTKIADKAFYKNTKLKSVTIPGNISVIGVSAFEGCKNLKTVKYNNGLLIIEARAFKNCTSLKKAVLPSTLTKINKRAFEGCKKLSAVSLKNGLLSIGVRAFSGCTSLKKVSIPKTVVQIGSYAFAECKSLSAVTFANYSGSRIKSLGTGVFMNDTALKKIKIPARLTKIPQKCFYGCKKLSSVTGMANVTYINAAAFYGCTSLKKITLPSKMQIIRKKAFYGCGKLKTVTIKSKGLTIVQSKAFKKCAKKIKFRCPDEKVKDYSKLLKGKYS